MMRLESEAQRVAEANRAAHRDLSNKANANRYALIFIYVYSVIYVCVNGGGYQLCSSAARDVDCIIDKIYMNKPAPTLQGSCDNNFGGIWRH